MERRWRKLAITREEVGLEGIRPVDLSPDGLDPPVGVGIESPAEGGETSPALGKPRLETEQRVLATTQPAAQVQGPVRYYPSNRLWFGMQDQGQARTMTVRCLAATDSVSLQTPEALFKGSDAFSIQVVEKKPGEEYLARVRLSADASVGRHNGILEIKWPEETGLRTFEIPISSIVRTAP